MSGIVSTAWNALHEDVHEDHAHKQPDKYYARRVEAQEDPYRNHHGYCARRAVHAVVGHADRPARSRDRYTTGCALLFCEVELHFDDRMQAALPQEKLAIMWDSLWGQAGAFHRIVRAEVTEQQETCAWRS
jgi:hypothetical protein